jgi:DNA-binding SARP family transcriptional activator/predicted ATPase/Flp pilus assembly protein TadD
MAHLRINVLGTLQVLLDGVPVQSFESDKVRALLAYLAVEADHPHSREALIGLLWPDCAEETARHNLRQALFNLRLALGDHTSKPPYLLISRSSIQFNHDSDYSLDLALFNDYFAKWDKNRNQEAAISRLEEMVDLYHGEFLKHFYIADSTEFEDWIVVQRESSRQQMMSALTDLANQHELLEDYQAARRFVERQLELDPWREEAHYQIMRLLALDGQRSAALAQYESCKKILAVELGVEPSTKTRELYEQIRSGTLKAKDKSTSQIPIRTVPSLPMPLTAFFGREQELLDLARMLADPEYRCITLVGPGGIGKTRLALQVANQQQHLFADGSAFIPLASVESMNAVIPTIANAIHFGFHGPTDPKIQLLNYLRDKHMLLIVDNVEHLLADQPVPGTVAELLMEILQQATRIKLLVTSRELINLQEEWPFEIQGLSFPTLKPGNDVDAYSAVALFVQRARRAYPGLELNREDKASVAHLCRLVEGMPLAIELAATWVRILPPTEIAREIEKSVDFLNAQMRDLPERHRSIRAVFDQSWKMLSNEEQRVLARLSIFRGGFQRQAAEKAAGAALPVLSSLVIRSLIRRTASGRYDLHELIRQYAAVKLAEDPQELDSTQERHSLYYLSFLEEQGVRLQSHQQKEAVAELTGDIDNIRAAWDWAVVNQNINSLVQTSEYLWWLLELHNSFKEGETIFWKTAEAFRKRIQGDNSNQIGIPVAVNMMLAHFGYFRFRQGKSEEAYQILSPCTTYLRASSELLAATISCWYLGIVCWELGRFEQAKESFQESLRLAQQRGIPWHEAAGSEFVGMVLYEQGDYHRSKQYLSEALALSKRIGDPSLTAHMMSYFSQTLTALGEYEEAEEVAQEGIHIGREIGWRTGTGLALDAMGHLAFAQGKNEEARLHFAESVSLFQEVGDTYRLARGMVNLGLSLFALNQVNEARENFNTALKLAYENKYISTTLCALIGLAAISAQQRGDSHALELVLFVLQHASSTQETKKIATQLRRDLESKLVQKEFEVVQQSAMLKNIDDFVRLFLEPVCKN